MAKRRQRCQRHLTPEMSNSRMVPLIVASICSSSSSNPRGQTHWQRPAGLSSCSPISSTPFSIGPNRQRKSSIEDFTAASSSRSASSDGRKARPMPMPAAKATTSTRACISAGGSICWARGARGSIPASVHRGATLLGHALETNPDSPAVVLDERESPTLLVVVGPRHALVRGREAHHVGLGSLESRVQAPDRDRTEEEVLAVGPNPDALARKRLCGSEVHLTPIRSLDSRLPERAPDAEHRSQQDNAHSLLFRRRALPPPQRVQEPVHGVVEVGDLVNDRVCAQKTDRPHAKLVLKRALVPSIGTRFTRHAIADEPHRGP